MADTMQQPAPSHYSMLVKGLLGLVAVIIVLAVFFGGYQGLRAVLGMRQGSSVPTDLQGELVFSVVNVSTTTGQTTGIVPIVISASSGDARYLPADQMADGRAAALQYAVSSNGTYATFLATPLSTSTSAWRTPGVFRANLAGLTSFDDISHALQQAAIAAAPSASDYFRESPAVATDGTILYASLDKQQFDAASSTFGTLPADSWSIYAIGTSGDPQMLTHGLAPKWVDATHFAYLKDDGVYYFDLESGTASKVWMLPTAPSLVTGFDVSDDGEFMALSDPQAHALTLVRCLDWASGLLNTFSSIAITATSPTFSPDDTYLAMVALSPSATGTSSPAAALRYYSMKSQAFIPEQLTLSSPLVGGLYLTDWR